MEIYKLAGVIPPVFILKPIVFTGFRWGGVILFAVDSKIILICFTQECHRFCLKFHTWVTILFAFFGTVYHSVNI